VGAVKRVYLLRHAKSSCKDRSLDRDRRSRGGEAGRAGDRRSPRGEGIRPELVLCSPARRARETLERVEGALGDEVEVVFEEGPYGASEAALLARLRALQPEVGSVLVMAQSGPRAARAGAGGEAELARVLVKYPTAALARLTCLPTAGTRSSAAAASSWPTCDHGTWARARVRPGSSRPRPLASRSARRATWVRPLRPSSRASSRRVGIAAAPCRTAAIAPAIAPSKWHCPSSCRRAVSAPASRRRAVGRAVPRRQRRPARAFATIQLASSSSSTPPWMPFVTATRKNSRCGWPTMRLRNLATSAW
jgi:phosphohistidine phosphatase